ncbi:MAG: sigma-70 family RNA polymerase sigma factor [Myxococcota bacterium]
MPLPSSSVSAKVASVSDPKHDRRDMFAAASGDAEAFGRLYDRYSGVMLAIAQRIVRNRREAEDLLHDVFVEAWNRAGDYDPARGTVRSWLLIRMRSRSLDRVKSAGFSRSRPLPEREDALGEVHPEVTARSDARALHRAIDGLPEDQQRVLRLGYFEGLSSSEIAEAEGIPIGTVKSRVAAAMGKLRTALREPEERRHDH